MAYTCPNCRSNVEEADICHLCKRPRVLIDLAYLNEIENQVQKLITAAHNEGLINDDFRPGPEDLEFMKMVHELAQTVRHFHYDGDGCLDES